MWVGIEATTIVSALLVGFSRTPQAIEAAWKYLILGSIGIGFALLGTLLVYASSVGVLGETSDALAWTRLVAIAPRLDPAFVRLAFIFALAGYGTKAGLAPFHTWLPDAHSQAPSPISAMLSGAALAVSLYALARFHLVATGTLGPAFSSTLLVVFGLLSLVVALPFIVAQGDLKRLLAYSSIEHLGLATLALGFGGHLALLGFTLHLACHGLAKSTVFLAAGQLVAGRGSRRIGRLGGSLARSPADGRALVVAALAARRTAAVGDLRGRARDPVRRRRRRLGPRGGDRGAGPGARGRRAPVPRRAGRGRAAGYPARSRSERSLASATPPAPVPLAVVVVAGVWTPSPLAEALDQVVVVLGGGGG